MKVSLFSLSYQNFGVLLIFSAFFAGCALGLEEHLHWDYCKKPKLGGVGAGFEVEELEVDPFPFFKDHVITFKLVRKFGLIFTHELK